MATTNDALPSNTIKFNMQNAGIKARDIGCNNTINNNTVYNQCLSVSGKPQWPALGGSHSSDDIVAKVISWLCPYSVDYFPAYEKARSQRAEDTGKWFFNAMKYKLWATVGFGKYRNLQCVGIPGAGKTTMAATVIKSLQDRFLAKRGLDIVLYVYFRHDTQATQSIPFVLASLLVQVIKHKRKVSTAVRKFYHNYSSHKDIPPAIDAMVTLLQSELSGFGRAYIIVDALDEYSLPDYFPSHALVEVLQRLNARLLITSRYEVGYSPNTSSTLLISAHADDIRIFVRKHLSGHLATVVARTPGLLEEIVRGVIIKSAGMFIVATLLVSCIPNSQSMTANDIRAAVKELPTGIEDTYKMAMRRIEDQDPHLAALGKQALYWVYFSKRRLTVMELRHALSFQHSNVISKDDLIGEDRIRSACAGLISFVKLKDKRKTVECQFSHFTMREFLDQSWQKYFPDGQRQVTETCLGYLAAAVSDVPPSVTEAAQLGCHTNFTWTSYWAGHGFVLCPYAVEHWASHARAIDEAFDLDAFSSFFTHPISPYTVALGFHLTVQRTGSMIPEHYWILYFARFGLLKLCQKFASDVQSADNGSQKAPVDYNRIRGRDGRTLLHLSALGGHPHVIEFLLDSGADVNVFDNDGNSPLHFAVLIGSIGHATAVQLLLNHGAAVDNPNRWERAPISYAIQPPFWAKPQGRSLDFVRLLLQYEVDIYRVDHENTITYTPLSLAQESKDPEIGQLLNEYACSHPPKPRTYEQRFPEAYFDSLVWELQHTSNTVTPT